ncbi:2-C-methyl-D-erythritol 4-phosphate cytidylyltransferase [Stenotrophobium rhamnosiphilum]|uniref:2-C-methyl-D-erythritol 4-phosphate cytidylyltransferase n=1 Tax=Stenotrophobium rhamnosiphilum TaxID=2029166 RepID=A0A2T5MHZ1_9GAMM|nr:2-C-methyl-D-erythritol 4-phosphate cytidylyltransferase [Stenotrophobium rhamnosiphilum]PTU32149.1 2-C-methyl-D-erythritol 4-phosphate cytidylyltransferase [Stenotrophobium rhamnosiphilum]
MNQTPRYWAVIPAAGGGTRMGLNRPKQYLPLRGRTILEWSLASFLDHDHIDGVVLVLAKNDQEYSKLPIARHPKIVTTHGGVARADSVLAGLEAVAARTQGFEEVFVMVHDAARPCVEWADIERLREEADDEHGGLLALPVTDTLKKSKQGKVSSTVDREFIWRAQTPQIFRLDLLMSSLKECAERGLEVTDEASAMERAGYTPRLVRGRDSNIKVTYAEDLAVAEFWLARQEQQP